MAGHNSSQKGSYSTHLDATAQLSRVLAKRGGKIGLPKKDPRPGCPLGFPRKAELDPGRSYLQQVYTDTKTKFLKCWQQNSESGYS